MKSFQAIIRNMEIYIYFFRFNIQNYKKEVYFLFESRWNTTFERVQHWKQHSKQGLPISRHY